jgi:hypothetical protein
VAAAVLRSTARSQRRDALISYQSMDWNDTLDSVSMRVNIASGATRYTRVGVQRGIHTQYVWYTKYNF